MKMINQKLLTFVLITLSLPSIAAFAQDPPPQSKPAMENMVVTATRTEERAIDVPVYTEVITREMIDMSGATHLGDLMSRYVTGNYMKFYDLSGRIGIRAGRTNDSTDIQGEVLILIDGHRIGTGNAAKISLDRVERVEVTKGPVSALYGSSAIDGIINLITRKGEGELTTDVSGEIGSFDYQRGRASTSGTINDKLRLDLAASYEDIYDTYAAPDNTLSNGSIYTSGISKENIGGNLTYQPAEEHELRLGGNYADLSEYSGDKDHAYLDLEYNGDFMEEQLHWRAIAYYLQDLYQNNQDGTVTTPSDDYKSTDTTWGTDQQIIWKASPSNTVVAGFALEKFDTKEKRYVGGQPEWPYSPNLAYNSQSLFAQEALDLWNNRVNFIAALRYDRFVLEAKRPETVEILDFNEKSEVFDHISPKVGIGVKFLDEMVRVRANAGEGFKSPGADQLSADYEYSATRYIGNPDLDPEISLTYDLGIDIFHDLFTIGATYFHSDYKDKINEVYSSDYTTMTWENRGKTELAGIDLNLEWRASRTFGWTADLSLWSKATVNTTKEDKETGEDLPFVSDYEIKSGLNLIRNNFTAQLIHVLIGPQGITQFDPVTYLPSGTKEKESFDFWDLTLRYQFKEHWEARASVLNLLNERIEWKDGYMDPARNYRIGVSYTF